MGVRVAISSLADGSMHNRANPLDSHILANRQAWLTSHGISMNDTSRLLIRFVGNDYCRYKEVGDAQKGINMYGDDDFIADAIVTTTPGHALLLPVADCIATTLFDPTRGVLALAHLGRHSLEQRGGIRIVEYLTQKHGVDPANLQVWLSPSINKDVYPIHKLQDMGMKEACLQQLHAAGVLPVAIHDDQRDTGTDNSLYSYSEWLKGNKKEDGCYAMVAVMTDEASNY